MTQGANAIGNEVYRHALRRLLRCARLAAGLKQAEVAVRLGVPQSFVSKYESGQRRLDLIELREVCTVLGTGLPALLAALDAEAAGERTA